jgi:predicted phage tail protein
VGYTINYAIDLQTNGGAFQTVIITSVTGKTTSGLRAQPPHQFASGATTWTVRLRKITADANSAKTAIQ